MIMIVMLDGNDNDGNGNCGRTFTWHVININYVRY